MAGDRHQATALVLNSLGSKSWPWSVSRVERSLYQIVLDG